MTEVTGSFERALVESSNVLSIRGRVLPSTLRDVTLMGELEDRAQISVVTGESNITETPGTIRRVFLRPDAPAAYPPVVRAIFDADFIIIGPGSLYTSIMPNLLIPDIAAALRASRAPKVYVCNTATQPGETDDYTVEDHIAGIERHTDTGWLTHVIVNNAQSGSLLPKLRWVSSANLAAAGTNGPNRPTIVTADVADAERPWRHDSVKLATILLKLYANLQAEAPVTLHSISIN